MATLAEVASPRVGVDGVDHGLDVVSQRGVGDTKCKIEFNSNLILRIGRDSTDPAFRVQTDF